MSRRFDGRQLRELRHRSGLSLRGLGDRAGRHFAVISKYELGQRQPSADALGRLADALDVSVNDLFSQAGSR